MNETKLGPHGETIDQDGEVIAWPSRRMKWWAATEGIRFIMLCGIVVVVAVVLMALVAA